jgi:hypothetical protein
MHDNRNFGVETMTTQKAAKVTLGVGQVLAMRVLGRVAGLRY